MARISKKQIKQYINDLDNGTGITTGMLDPLDLGFGSWLSYCQAEKHHQKMCDQAAKKKLEQLLTINKKPVS